MDTETGYLESNPGRKSSERLKSFLIVIATIALIFFYVGIKEHEPSTEFNFLVLIMFTAGLAPTALKKIVEIRAGGSYPTTTTEETSESSSTKVTTE